MFLKGKEKTKLGKIDNLIGKYLSIEGNISAGGSIRIDGQIKGGVESQGDIYVGETGVISGDVRVKNMLVAGMVTGNVHADRLEIERTGRLVGDIRVLRLMVAEGAQFRGRCLVGDQAPDPGEGPGDNAEGDRPPARHQPDPPPETTLNPPEMAPD